MPKPCESAGAGSPLVRMADHGAERKAAGAGPEVWRLGAETAEDLAGRWQPGVALLMIGNGNFVRWPGLDRYGRDHTQIRIISEFGRTSSGAFGQIPLG